MRPHTKENFMQKILHPLQCINLKYCMHLFYSEKQLIIGHRIYFTVSIIHACYLPYFSQKYIEATYLSLSKPELDSVQ